MEIASDAAPGRYPVACAAPQALNTDGTSLETTCDDGAIVVSGSSGGLAPLYTLAAVSV